MVAIFRFAVPARKEWSPAEQAEFVRAAAILRGTGLPIACETGLSDEGDPWVIFLREDTGDVIAHIAKIDGQVMAASAATGDVVCGPSFRTVMDKVVRSQPLVLPATTLGDRVHLHPTTVIIAFIATALAWSVEDDSRQYDWKVDGEGTVALVGGRDASGNVLRDSLFSKAEASRLGLDGGGHQLSNSLVVAAALAAVALVAKSLELMSDETARLAATPDPADRSHAVAQHDGNAVPADAQAAVADGAAAHGSSEGEQLDVAEPGHDGTLWRAVVDKLAAQNIKLLFDAGRAGELPDLPLLPTDTAGLADGLLETVALRTLPPVSEMAAQETPALAAVNAPRNEVEATEESATTVSHTVAHTPQAQGPTFTVHGTSELSKLLGLSSDAFGPSRLTFSVDGPDAHQPVAVSAGTSDLIEDLPQPETTATTTTTTTETPNSGYRLIDDILTFAANSSHELSASAAAIRSLNGALADPTLALILPSADRILIIDLPNLNADFFQFVKGLTMMSRSAAEELMPSLALQAQAEFALANGETLKLMGIIDLNDYNATGTHV